MADSGKLWLKTKQIFQFIRKLKPVGLLPKPQIQRRSPGALGLRPALAAPGSLWSLGGFHQLRSRHTGGLHCMGQCLVSYEVLCGCVRVIIYLIEAIFCRMSFCFAIILTPKTQKCSHCLC